jgi:large subunit ribosomal protein L28
MPGRGPTALTRPARVARGSSDILRYWCACGPLTTCGLPTTRLTFFPNWSDPVASVCDVCGKGPGFGNNVSFSHRRTPRRWNPNIQRVRAIVGKTPRRLNVCTSCIKAGKVARAR